MVGTYEVQIEAFGKTDPDLMSVSAGSADTVLLTFVSSFGKVRSSVIGSTGLSLPRQKVKVPFPTGAADAQVTGGGSISAAGEVDVTLVVRVSGFTAPDGGAGMDSEPYYITGTRQ